MHVQVRYGLAGLLLAVDDKPVAVGKAELFGELGGDEVQMADHLAVFGGDVIRSADLLLGDNQHMNGCLGADIVEGEAKVVLVNDLGGDLLADDLEEKIVGHHDKRLQSVWDDGETGGRIPLLACGDNPQEEFEAG